MRFQTFNIYPTFKPLEVNLKYLTSTILYFSSPVLDPITYKAQRLQRKHMAKKKELDMSAATFQIRFLFFRIKKKNLNYIFDNQKIKNNFPFLKTEASNF